MKIAITGADGLLGSNIVRQLISAGHNVRAFLLEGRDTGTLDGLDIERLYGNILEPGSLIDAFSGVDAVIHAAASTSVYPYKSETVRKINIIGTGNVIDAALSVGIKRFIHIGTANSFDPGSKDKPGDETGGYSYGYYGLDYMDSKYEAQKRVLEAVKTRGLPALIINPTFMIGPYDSAPSSGKLLLNLYQGRVFGYTGGGRCFTPAVDVASAVVNALSLGRVGECYIAGGKNLNYKEFFSLASGVMGIKPPSFKIPRPIVLAVSIIQTIFSKITGKPPSLSYINAKISFDGHYYDPSKARDELKMPSTSLEEAVNQSFRWLKANGYLENK